jgi:hypothetical protein
MRLTNEQIAIVNSQEKEIKIIAGAGAAKTTTLVEFTKVRPNKKFLYIAFNKSVQQEGAKKFGSNVLVKTAHGLAYSNFVKKRYKVVNELKEKDFRELFDEYSDLIDFPEFVYTLKRCFELYCHLPHNKALTPSQIKSNNTNFVNNVNKAVGVVVNKMLKGEIPLTHDAYLKFYMLTNPQLDFDYILFDEGQDASPVMLRIFASQDSRKIIVGDPNQSIYRFRHAINALGKLNYKTYPLSVSFRFGNDIAEKANSILYFKQKMKMPTGIKIIGGGGNKYNSENAILCRSNSSVLDVLLTNPNKRIYLEGGKQGYNFSAGGLLSDVYKLKKGKHGLIKNDLIRNFKDINEAYQFAKKVGDVKIISCIEIINRYGGNIFKEIKEAKNRIVNNRMDADLIVSTIHKAKGMEYSSVTLASDIKKPEEILDAYKKTEQTYDDYKWFEEELNLIYVAVTRAINRVL